MDEGGQEKRRFVRANFPCEIIVFTPEKYRFTSQTENIGAGGLRIVVREKLSMASTVELKIYFGDEPIVCKGKVVWMIEKVPSLFDIGLEFFDLREKDRIFIDSLVQSMVDKDSEKESKKGE